MTINTFRLASHIGLLLSLFSLTACPYNPTKYLKSQAESELIAGQEQSLAMLSSIMVSEGDSRQLLRYLNAYIDDEHDPGSILLARYLRAETLLRLDRREDALEAARFVARDALSASRDDIAANSFKLVADTSRIDNNYASVVESLQDFSSSLPKHAEIEYVRRDLAIAHIRNGNTNAAAPILSDLVANAQDQEIRADAATILARLNSNRSWIRATAEELIGEISASIDDRNVADVVGLVSKAGFARGDLGSHRADWTWQQFEQALKAEFAGAFEPSIDGEIEIGGSSDKRYLLSSGWSGQHIDSVSILELQRAEFGWEWSGISRVPENAGAQQAAVAVNVADPPPSGQPLDFELRAPWRPGTYMLSGRLILSGIIGLSRCAQLIGWPGSYYGEGGHKGDDYYAIDFNRWGSAQGCPGKKRWRIAAGVLTGGVSELSCSLMPVPLAGDEVRAVADGRVTRAWANDGTVEIQHRGPGGVDLPYRSRYLHMRALFVSTGNFVARGQPIGEVGNRGDSTGAHLHFAVYDDRVNNDSVMLNPMDGEDRGIIGHPKCMTSSNNLLFEDNDNDDVPDSIDNCLGVPNPTQANFAGGGDPALGDACEDQDGDTHLDALDNCIVQANADQSDLDRDGRGDLCDTDIDGDGAECTYGPGGRACVPANDNCPLVPNPRVDGDQPDMDNDGVGNACDDDIDGDNRPNDEDECPFDDANTCAMTSPAEWIKELLELQFRFREAHERIFVNIPSPCPPQLQPCSFFARNIELRIGGIPDGIGIALKNTSNQYIDEFSGRSSARIRFDQGLRENLYLEIQPLNERALNRDVRLDMRWNLRQPDISHLIERVNKVLE